MSEMELGHLPDLPLERVIEFLDYPNRRNCRLVSQKMKYVVDDIGHSIKIDSRNPGSQHFCKQVNAEEVRIMHLKSFDLEPEIIQKWKTAIISGTVDNAWMTNRFLKNCSNLRILILNEDALCLEEFNALPSPDYAFHHLAELHIRLNMDGNGLEEILGKDFHPRHPDYHQRTRPIATRVQKNLGCFLAVIRSRALKLLNISILDFDWEERSDETRLEICWNLKPLFKFLQYHRNSLETLILPQLPFCKPLGVDQLAASMQIPTRLKGIQLTPAEDGAESLPNYWTNLLLKQCALENLLIYLIPEDQSPPFPWLESLVSNNSKTLTRIHLSAFPSSTIDQTIDMRAFGILESLKSLYISARIKILNLNELPSQYLTKLSLCGVRITADFDGIRLLESCKLRTLSLERLSLDDGYFKHPGYTTKFIKLALRCREMNTFSFLHYYETSANVELDESWLASWIAKLESEKLSNNPKSFNIKFPGLYEKYEESEQLYHEFADMDFMEMMNLRANEGDFSYPLEQPFYLNRNGDSFSCWLTRKKSWTRGGGVHIQFDMKKFKFLENRKSYSEMVTNIGDMKIYMTVTLKRENDALDAPLVKPAGLLELGVSEEELIGKNRIELQFYSKS